MNRQHLGERRFEHYPLFLAVDLQRRLRRIRRTMLAAVFTGVLATAVALILTR